MSEVVAWCFESSYSGGLLTYAHWDSVRLAIGLCAILFYRIKRGPWLVRIVRAGEVGGSVAFTTLVPFRDIGKGPARDEGDRYLGLFACRDGLASVEDGSPWHSVQVGFLFVDRVRLFNWANSGLYLVSIYFSKGALRVLLQESGACQDLCILRLVEWSRDLRFSNVGYFVKGGDRSQVRAPLATGRVCHFEEFFFWVGAVGPLGREVFWVGGSNFPGSLVVRFEVSTVLRGGNERLFVVACRSGFARYVSFVNGLNARGARRLKFWCLNNFVRCNCVGAFWFGGFDFDHGENRNSGVCSTVYRASVRLSPAITFHRCVLRRVSSGACVAKGLASRPCVVCAKNSEKR